MDQIYKIILSLSLLTILIYSQTVAAQMQGGPGGGQRRGPPEEAINACKSKSVGARVRFKTPRGDTISATCKMIAVPDGRSNPGRSRQSNNSQDQPGNNQQQRPSYQR